MLLVPVDGVLLGGGEEVGVEELCVLVRAVVGVGVLQPLGQDRLELAHVLEGEVEGLEPGDGGLGEVVAVELAQSQAHVALGVAKLDPLLLEHLGKLLQFLQVRILLRRQIQAAAEHLLRFVGVRAEEKIFQSWEEIFTKINAQIEARNNLKLTSKKYFW